MGTKQMRLPVQIEGIVFRKKNNDIEYLLVKRLPERGGFWQPITGGLEKGETKLSALRREIEEEIRIKNLIRIIKNIHYFEFLEKRLIKEYVFGVEVLPTERVILDKREHSMFKWCGFSEAYKLLKWKDNKMALKKLNKMLLSDGMFSNNIQSKKRVVLRKRGKNNVKCPRRDFQAVHCSLNPGRSRSLTMPERAS